MNDAQIKHMVDRFLAWKLPEDFSPDCGISFKRESDFDHPRFGRTKYAPIGTNLLHAGQAEAMIRHMLEELPEEDGPECAIHGPVCVEPCVWCRLDDAQSLAQERGLQVVALREALEWTPINELEPAMGERLFVTFNDGNSIWASDIHWDSIADSNPYITHGMRLPDPAPLQLRVLTFTASAAEEARKGIEVEVRQAIWSKLHDGELNWPNIKAAILGAGEGEP